MFRRAHRKSRNGCAQCKKRHIRCDESQPACANCRAADVECSFFASSSAFVAKDPPFQTDNPTSSVSENCTATPNDSIQASVHALHVNIAHLELFHNLTSPDFSTTFDQKDTALVANVFIPHALQAPYLMHQLLALSALHLSVTRPTQQKSFQEYAICLQDHALSLFKTTTTEVDETNSVPLFLFSSMVGIYVLCDTLRCADYGLDQILHSFTLCLNLHRGVFEIFQQCWPLLHKSQLSPILAKNDLLMNAEKYKGTECSVLQNRVGSMNIDTATRVVYQESVAHLQDLFDVQRATMSAGSWNPVFLSWLVTVSPAYIGLLMQREPEAIIVLAYYAVLLDHARGSWIVGDGGRFLIRAICEELGSHWPEWLALPISILEEVPGA